jgi:ubiquinone/menaquinone biosynthesis C-methylase UbiE
LKSRDVINWRRSRVLAAILAVAVAVAGAGCKPRHATPNDAYLDPRVSTETWNRLFQSEGREIYERRELVMKLAAVKPGMTVADVGAGTGVFTMMLSDVVGSEGRVYAEEILDKFSRYIAQKAAREGRDNVVSVVGTERGVGLPPGSIDLAFLCDVYHHFDYPEEMLASIRSALREQGEVFLVEFRREPGRSPAWVFEHVRAGEELVLHEFEAVGFVRLSRDYSLRDSYVWRLRRTNRAELWEAARPPADAEERSR